MRSEKKMRGIVTWNTGERERESKKKKGRKKNQHNQHKRRRGRETVCIGIKENKQK